MARERGDYSYLEGRTPEQAFREAYVTPTYGSLTGYWPLDLTGQMLRLFEGHDRLGQEEAVERFRALFGKRSHTPAFVASRAGNAIGWAVRIGFVLEAEPDGWTMPDREPWFVYKRGGARQVRGLTGDAFAEHNKREARQAKLQATLRAKAAAKHAARIEANLSRLLMYDPDFVIPAGPTWSQYLPTLTLPVRLVEVMTIVRDAAPELHWRDQKRWRLLLSNAAFAAKREAERAAREERAADQVAEQAADDAALEDL